MEKITSVHNPRIKAAMRLREPRGRNQQGRIIIDGVREIGRAVESGLRLAELFVCPPMCDARSQWVVEQAMEAAIEVTPDVFAKLAFGERAEGLVAVAATPDCGLARLQLGPQALVAVLERLEKPGNLGAVLRTADAAGVAAVIVADSRVELYNPNAIRASLGAIFTLPVAAADTKTVLEWLRANRFAIFAARVDGDLNYTQANLRDRSAVVLGSEADGLSETWTGPGITAISLPLLGRLDSLNVSTTAAVLFYEALRQRETARQSQ